MSRGPVLIQIAREAIAETLDGMPAAFQPSQETWLNESRAVFVTLTQHGALRGCIGQLTARWPLQHAVRRAAASAAVDDPRFLPVQSHDLSSLRVEVSVLSPIEPLGVESEDELLTKIRPGVDGLWLSHGTRSGVFIPEVWKQLETPRQFLTHLKQKAGLPTNEWLPGTEVSRFTAEVFHEE